MKINFANKTNFNANLIAKSGNLKICELTDIRDFSFLDEFCKRTDFKTLMPKLPRQKAQRWHEMLEYAVDCAKSPGNTTYIEISDNKLCGIITYFRNKTAIVDCICTIPIKAGEKVKLAGKTLFYQVFKDFIEYNGRRIELAAIVDGPYNTIEKYKSLGFKETSNATSSYVEMEAGQYSIKDTMQSLKSLIPYKPMPQEKINLRKTITN